MVYLKSLSQAFLSVSERVVKSYNIPGVIRPSLYPFSLRQNNISRLICRPEICLKNPNILSRSHWPFLQITKAEKAPIFAPHPKQKQPAFSSSLSLALPVFLFFTFCGKSMTGGGRGTESTDPPLPYSFSHSTRKEKGPLFMPARIPFAAPLGRRGS